MKPAPFWKADPRAWPLFVEMCTASGRRWAPEMMAEDLRWMLDQVRMGRLDRIPGRPTLRKRWNTTDRAVRNALKELGGRTATGQPADSERTATGQPAQGSTPAMETERTATGQLPDSERTVDVHTRVVDRATEHRAQSTEHLNVEKLQAAAGGTFDPTYAEFDKEPREPIAQTSLPLDSPESREPEPEQQPGKPGPLARKRARDDDWARLNELYGSLPNRSPLRKRGGELGRNLQRLLDHHGFDGTSMALQWMAYGKGPKIDSLRESGCDTLATIGREKHAEAYGVYWRRWDSKGRPGVAKPRKYMNNIDPYAPKPEHM